MICTKCGEREQYAKLVCRRCYERAWARRNPDKIKAKNARNVCMAGEEASDIFLEVMSRALGVQCTFEIWQGYLLWLSQEQRRLGLKNKLAGLIHANQKRYRAAKREELVARMERGVA